MCFARTCCLLSMQGNYGISFFDETPVTATFIQGNAGGKYEINSDIM